jgi:multimeric flavodoxin WrbA
LLRDAKILVFPTRFLKTSGDFKKIVEKLLTRLRAFYYKGVFATCTELPDRLSQL